MILHYARNSRAVRVAWLLEELSLQYKLEKYTLGEKRMRETEFLKINPLGRVPVLEDNETILTESGAIIQYILNKYGQNKFTPNKNSEDYPLYLQWFHFAEGMIMPQMNIIVVETILLPKERKNEVNVKRATKILNRMLEVVEKFMEQRDYLAGEFSAADIMTGHAIIMSEKLGIDFGQKPNLNDYIHKLKSRPTLQKAWHL